MRGANLVGWGPLAPGEDWGGVGTPTLYLKANTTFARYAPSPELREIDPAGFGAPPREPLAAAAFLDSLPSPRLNMDRVEFIRAPDRAGLIRLSPAAAPVDRSRPPEPAPQQPVTQVRPPPPVRRAAVERPIIVMAPAPDPIIETYYVAPIYTGIIVMNPVEKKPPKTGKRPDKPDEAAGPEDAAVTQVARQESDDRPVPRSGEGNRRRR
jgi:hypothetical protein